MYILDQALHVTKPAQLLRTCMCKRDHICTCSWNAEPRSWNTRHADISASARQKYTALEVCGCSCTREVTLSLLWFRPCLKLATVWISTAQAIPACVTRGTAKWPMLNLSRALLTIVSFAQTKPARRANHQQHVRHKQT
jgi:hypothetical protein